MLYDSIPIPSKGLFYKSQSEFLKVYFMTTEDELTLTAPNLFNQGMAFQILLERLVCEPNNLSYNELLMIDKEFLLLYLKETAYGHIIEYEGDEKVYFDTRNIQIKNIELLPDDGELFTHVHNTDILKIKLLRVADERFIRKGRKLDGYIQMIFSINGNEDRKYIKHYFETMPILESRRLRNYIDKLNFGLVKKTFCLINDKKTDMEIQIDESLFGLNQENLPKVNKNINDGISFLCNEGNGYTMEAIFKLPVHIRKFHEENLIKKITKINESMK